MKKKTEQVHCNSCHGETRHVIVAKRVQRGTEQVNLGRYEDDSFDVSWNYTYTLLECAGCDSVVLRRVAWFSEWDGAETTFFPPRISRVLPSWNGNLEPDQRSLMKEVYAALHADSLTLATMGARALVDMVMNKEVGDTGGFAAKMSEMKKRGIISQLNAEILEAALDVGHAAAHRGHRPESIQVDQVMDIVENLLHTHVLKKAADSLKASTPKRANQHKSKKTGAPKSPPTIAATAGTI